MEESEVQRQVRAGAHREIHAGVAADWCHPWIHDHELSTAIPAAPDVVSGNGCALCDVCAGDKDDLRLRNIAPGQRAAIHTERQLVGGSRGDHTEPAVVVDVPGAERHARKLSEQVGLFGDERSAAIDGHAVLTVLLLDLL